MAEPFHPSTEGAAADAKGQVLHSLHCDAPPDASRSTADPRVDELVALRRQNQRLREIAGEAVVEQAKGALMLLYGIDAERAHGVLVGWSQDCNIDVHALADTLVNVVCCGADRRHAVEPTVVRWLEEHLRRGREPDGDAVAAPSQP